MTRFDRYSDSQANALAEKRTNGKPHRGLETLLPWFVTGFRAEVPDRLHTRGVWRDSRRRGDDEDYQPVGGSLIGAPRMADPFRAYIESDPFDEEVAEYDGHKVLDKHLARPMQAALKRLAGRHDCSVKEPDGTHRCEPRPFMARALFRTALRDGDWDGACASLGIVEPVRQPYIEAALWHLWRVYKTEPDARPIKFRAA